MFAKIFTQIFDSSIAENHLTRLVFTDLLTLADINGVVDMTHEAIARRTNVPLDTVLAAIAELECPDPKSRTPDADGRRIQRLDDHRDWGWVIVNYQKFREIASEEQRRAKTLARVHKYRGKEPVTQCNAPVTPINACNAMQREREREKKSTPKPPKGGSVVFPENLTTDNFKAAWSKWEDHRKEIKKPLTPTSANQQLRQMSAMGESRAIAAIEFTVGKGWQGLSEPGSNQRPRQQNMI